MAIRIPTQPETELQQPAEGPFLIEFFMVEGDDFRCMAYCDQAGKWRNAFNHVELPGVVHILE